MFSKSFCVAFILLTLNYVLSQPDLRQNPKLDSISYEDHNHMYFFTSSGFYWHLKEEQLIPRKEEAKLLPNWFKEGDAAVFINAMNICSKAETQYWKRKR